MTQRQDNGRWEPPGGVLELDESIEDALKREVREETGYEVELISLTGVYKNMARHIVALVFSARVTDGEAQVSSETKRVEWWSPDQLEHRMEEAYAIRILDALTDDIAPSIRSHDGHHLISSA